MATDTGKDLYGTVGLRSKLGEEIEDVAEETFLLFAQEIPSQNLGFVNSKATSLDIDVGPRTYTIKQSPGLLQSDRDAGTTGAVLWKVTPLVANWLSSSDNFLWKLGYLRSDSTIIELGCGISGLIALSLSSLLSSGVYVLTDQAYVMKTLHQNIDTNQTDQSRGKHPRRRLQIRTLALDWETDAVSNVSTHLGKDNEIDLIVACDCIYNEYLIQPFISTCAGLCALRSKESKKTGLLIAQQLRSEDVLQLWLDEMLKCFLVFRVPASLLPDELRKGHVIHFAILRRKKPLLDFDIAKTSETAVFLYALFVWSNSLAVTSLSSPRLSFFSYHDDVVHLYVPGVRNKMYSYGDMKGWQAVPIVIPLFLVTSLATIWYYSFRHLKGRRRYQDITSPVNSSLQPSRSSDIGTTGPPNSTHLTDLTDVPPVPPDAHSNERREGSPAPSSALRAQRSKESLKCTQYKFSQRGAHRGKSDGNVRGDDWDSLLPDRPQSYVIDIGTPPPIPQAHLRSPASQMDSAERPTPLTPLSALSIHKKRRKPALRLDLESHSAHSSPLSHLTASRGSANDDDGNTMGAGHSLSSTKTPSLSSVSLPPVTAPPPLNHRADVSNKPDRTFIVRNPKSPFPTVKREHYITQPNFTQPSRTPPIPTNPVLTALPVPPNDDPFHEIQEKPSPPTNRSSYLNSLTQSLHTMIHSHSPHSSPPHTNTANTDLESQTQTQSSSRPPLDTRSISGPSLSTFPRRSRAWSITDSEPYRAASPIPYPLIEHPDLEKDLNGSHSSHGSHGSHGSPGLTGFQRPTEWGRRTPDLEEARVISERMRRVERIRRERLAEVDEEKSEGDVEAKSKGEVEMDVEAKGRPKGKVEVRGGGEGAFF